MTGQHRHAFRLHVAIAMCVEGRPDHFVAVVRAKHAKAPVSEVSSGIGIQQLVRGGWREWVVGVVCLFQLIQIGRGGHSQLGNAESGSLNSRERQAEVRQIWRIRQFKPGTPRSADDSEPSCLQALSLWINVSQHQRSPQRRVPKVPRGRKASRRWRLVCVLQRVGVARRVLLSPQRPCRCALPTAPLAASGEAYARAHGGLGVQSGREHRHVKRGRSAAQVGAGWLRYRRRSAEESRATQRPCPARLGRCCSRTSQ